MKIIARGQLPEEKVYQASCSYCGTIVEFERKEAQYSSNFRNGSYLSVICPVCNRLIYKEMR